MFTLSQGPVSSSLCPARKGAGGAQAAERGHSQDVWRKVGQRLRNIPGIIGMVVGNCFLLASPVFLGVYFYLFPLLSFFLQQLIILFNAIIKLFLSPPMSFLTFTLPNPTGMGNGACAVISCQLGLNHN